MAVIDTSFLIDLERGSPSAVAAYDHLISEDQELLVPAQAALEYLAAYDDPALNLEDLERSFRLVPFGRVHLIQSARLAHDSLRKGTFPGWADAAIGSTAVLEAEVVVTSNPRHFKALGCEVWDYRNEASPPE